MDDYLGISGKTALITGAGRGIGAATAKSLAHYGAEIFLCDVREQEGIEVEHSIRSMGGHAKYLHCDVTDQKQVDAMLQEILSRSGSIQILVNNAGIGSPPVPFDSIDDVLWERMLSVDLTAPFRLCRAVAPIMKKQQYGKIINIGSGSGVIGCAFCAHYASAKAGLIGLTQSIAKELAPYHINVNLIAAPTTDTAMLKETQFDTIAEKEVAEIPWGRIGTPEDIANMILYLASDVSEYVTGQILAPNGGRRTPI